MNITAYGVSEGEGGATRLTKELHGCLTCGGGKPGQGYACVFIDGGGRNFEYK
jgi:hypothetical protein